MNNRFTFIYIGIVIALLLGCDSRKMTSELDAISIVADENPDSALTLLGKYEHERSGWGKGDRMHYELVKMKAENKADILFTTDSVAQLLADYYHRKGSPNEKMLAYYLLGRAHSDIEEAPEALQAYYDAIAMADTTSADCDYATLTAVYGQMSRIFHQQNLPHDEIWALRHYIMCMEKSANEMEVIIARGQMTRPYFLLGEEDSVLLVIGECYKHLEQLGHHQEAVGSLGPAIFIHTMRGDIQKANDMMQLFEHESGLFDADGNIAPGRESYYFTKGFYELAVGRNDLAEKYFRKVIHYGYLSEGYRGLLSVYRDKGNMDSIIAFSISYEAAQDTLRARTQTETIHQMSSLYNYSRSQKIAEQERTKAQSFLNLLLMTTLVAIVLFVIVVIVAWLYRMNQNEKRARIAFLENNLNQTIEQRSSIQEELKQLKDKDYEGVIQAKELQERELTKAIERLMEENEQYKRHSDRKDTDSIEEFLNTSIAQLFIKKSLGKTEKPKPSEAEWNLLTSNFSKYLPAMFKSFGGLNSLSQLELRICMLLILDISEKNISLMTQSSPSTISNGKARANQKLYGEKDASSLKSNLFQAIGRS